MDVPVLTRMFCPLETTLPGLSTKEYHFHGNAPFLPIFIYFVTAGSALSKHQVDKGHDSLKVVLQDAGRYQWVSCMIS